MVQFTTTSALVSLLLVAPVLEAAATTSYTRYARQEEFGSDLAAREPVALDIRDFFELSEREQAAVAGHPHHHHGHNGHTRQQRKAEKRRRRKAARKAKKLAAQQSTGAGQDATPAPAPDAAPAEAPAAREFDDEDFSITARDLELLDELVTREPHIFSGLIDGFKKLFHIKDKKKEEAEKKKKEEEAKKKEEESSTEARDLVEDDVLELAAREPHIFSGLIDGFKKLFHIKDKKKEEAEKKKKEEEAKKKKEEAEDKKEEAREFEELSERDVEILEGMIESFRRELEYDEMD